MAQITIQGRPVTVSDDFFKLSPEEQDATVDEIAAELGAMPAEKPQRSFTELPGNIIPSAIDTASGIIETIKDPGPIIDAAQGAVDRLVPEALTRFMDTYVSPRSPETRERQREVSGAVGQGLKDRYWGPDAIRNTMITDPVGFGLDAASLAAPALGVAGKGPMAGRAAVATPEKVLDVGRPAVRKITDAMKADNVTPEKIADLGPEGMLMDAGPNLRKQGRGVFLHQGEGSQVIDEALKRRNEGTTERALAAADDAMGKRVNAVEHRERLEQARAGQGRPLYDAAFKNAQMVNTNPVVEAIDEVIAPNVAGKGPEALSESGKRLSRYRDRLINSRGQTTEARVLQQVYIDLGDDIGEAIRAGRGGEARRLIEIKKKLEGSIDEATQGGFSKANAQWATDSEILDAFGFGEDLARNNLTPDEVAARLRKMKPEARAQVVPGLRNWVYEVVGTARNDAAAARALLQRGWTQEKLAMVLGKDKADELAKRIGLERTYAETNQRVRLNSNTAEGFSGAMDVADPSLLGKGNKEAFAYGGVQGLARKKALDMVDAVVDKLASRRGDVTRGDLAKMLTATGAKRDEIVRLLTDPKAVEAFRRGGIAPKAVTTLLRGLVAERAAESVHRPTR